jgi:hypothetical protein
LHLHADARKKKGICAGRENLMGFTLSHRAPTTGKKRKHPFLFISFAPVFAVISIMLIVTQACSIGPTEIDEQSFTVDGLPTVVVNGENGGIKVNAGTGNEVTVKATLRGTDRITYELNRDGDTITADIDIENAWWFFGGSPSVDLIITAPPETNLELFSSNGSIEISGMEGVGNFETSNGRIALENVKGDYEAKTSNGRIEVDTMEGNALLRTSNGKLELRDVKGEFDVQTSNGSIRFLGELIAGGNNRLVTSNGDVDVELQGTPNVSLDAETSNGKVTSELPITATSTGDAHLVGTIGDGEADLHVRTSNGDVKIR